MQVQARLPRKPRQSRRGAALVIIGALLLVIGLAGLFSLQGKAVRFDKAYDTQGDLSPFFFSKPEEGQGYSLFQNLWFGVARYRLWIMLAGLALAIGFVALTRCILIPTPTGTRR